MPRTTPRDPNRTQRACVTCREKKRKCPGEQPECSLCIRLHQTCSYNFYPINYNRQRVGPPPDRVNSEDRIRRLESHIDRIYGVLNGTNQTIPGDTSSLPIDVEARRRHTTSAILTSNTVADTTIPLQDDAWSSTWDFERSTITRAVNVYISKIHCQPLPLFDTFSIESDAIEWPRCLLLSLIAVTSRLSPDVMPGWTANDRRDCYKKARRELMIRVAEDVGHLEVLQSFCLLILEDIAEQNKRAVWLDVGIGARLATMDDPPFSSTWTGEWSRACWSLYILDLVYNSGFSTIRAFPEDFDLDDYPRSPPVPETRDLPDPSDMQPYNGLDQLQSAASTDIDACCLCLLSVWSHALICLQDMRYSRYQVVWSEHEGYQELLIRLSRFEMSMAQPHRLRKVKVYERSSLQLEAGRGYWASWLNMQFLYHTIQATINHPFLHITARHKNRTTEGPSVLQHAIDQMLLHSSWVTKLIDFCKDKKFVINDPFVAHLVAIVAAGYIFFLSNSDPRIAAQARGGFDTCYGFIARSAVVWTHLTTTIYKLDILKASSGNQSSTNNTNRTPQIQTSLLWNLFDYASSTTPDNISTNTAATAGLNETPQFPPSPNSIYTPRVDQSRYPEVGSVMGITASDQDSFQQNRTTSYSPDKEASIFDSFVDLEIRASYLESDSWTELGQL